MKFICGKQDIRTPARTQEQSFSWPKEFAGARVLLSAYEDTSPVLRPYEAVMRCRG